jgi:hypothetical protein
MVGLRPVTAAAACGEGVTGGFRGTAAGWRAADIVDSATPEAIGGESGASEDAGPAIDDVGADTGDVAAAGIDSDSLGRTALAGREIRRVLGPAAAAAATGGRTGCPAEAPRGPGRCPRAGPAWVADDAVDAEAEESAEPFPEPSSA